jgi:DNA-binding response OmpR family regulator
MFGVETPGGILVVEDDELVRSFLCSALAAARTVQGASDAKSGLRTAAVSPFALILVDCLLPDMHGTDLSRRLRPENTDAGTILIPRAVVWCAGPGSLRPVC